jgi:hypothetical protein
LRIGSDAVDYELAYVERRAHEEQRAAAASTWPAERDEHLRLARLFEEHVKRLQRSVSAEA